MVQPDSLKKLDKLDDKSLSNRINHEILDPFKNNPYTQSLSSFAY